MVNDMEHHLFPLSKFERWGLCAIWSSMNRPDLIRFCVAPLLGLAAAPAFAQPPAVAPTLPAPPPVPIPTPSAAQQVWLNNWLKGGAEQGLMARSKATSALASDALISAVLDRAKALSTGRVDTADFLNIWALRPAAFDPRPGLARAIAEDRLPQWAAGDAALFGL
jgi:hypothetical protein